MSAPEVCPHCGIDLRGEPIPEESLSYYGGSTHFSNCIGVEIPSVYDGVLFWVCPSCDKGWQRFADPRMMAKAQPYIDERNKS